MLQNGWCLFWVGLVSCTYYYLNTHQKDFAGIVQTCNMRHLIFQQIASIAEDAFGEDQEERKSISSKRSSTGTITPVFNNECSVADRGTLTAPVDIPELIEVKPEPVNEAPDIEYGKSVFYVVWD